MGKRIAIVDAPIRVSIDPAKQWSEDHCLPDDCLPAEVTVGGLRGDILDVDQRLWALQFEYKVLPVLNREIWEEYARQSAIAEELGEFVEPNPKLGEPGNPVRPRCRLTHEWLEEFPKLSPELIGRDSLPRYNPITTRMESLDWEAMVAWRADVLVAIKQLNSGDRALAEMAKRGYSLSRIAGITGLPIRDVITNLRRINGHVHKHSREDLRCRKCMAKTCKAAERAGVTPRR